MINIQNNYKMVLYIYKYWSPDQSEKLFNIKKFFYVYSNNIQKLNVDTYDKFENFVLDYLIKKKSYKEFSEKYDLKILHNNKNLLDFSNDHFKIILLNKDNILKEEFEEFKFKNDICRIQKINNEKLLNKLSLDKYLNRESDLGSRYYSVKCIKLFTKKNKTITKISFLKKKNNEFSVLFDDIKYYPYFDKIKDRLIKLDFIEDYNLKNIEMKQKLNIILKKVKDIKKNYN
jgi:hypothetical protein